VLNYGVVLTGARLKKWHLRCIEQLHQSKLALLDCVVNASGVSGDSNRPQRYRSVDAEAYCSLGEIFKIVPDAALYEGSAPQQLNVDFFLLLGDEEAGVPYVGRAPYGIWYFAFGDITRFSTSVPGFWEVHGDHDVTGAYLLQLRGDGTAGVPLKRGYLPTLRQSYEKNAAALLDAIVKWPEHVCWDITHNAASYFAGAPLVKPQQHYDIPTASDLAVTRLRERVHRAKVFVRNNFFSIEWTVARVKESPADFIGKEARANVACLFASDKRHYFADPFIITRDSRSYVFYEEYRSSTQLGSVAVSELSENGACPPQPAIEEPHHLSYPHVFEHRGELYCVPESVGIRKVCLYRCVEFPLKWEYVRTLVEGFEAADSTILQHDGRWWLFCASNDSNAKRYYSHLYIWYADDLFGTWTQHVRNPVKIDARSARPAGPFFEHEGALYRPAQDCSRSYGGAVRINRIDKLTATDFEETVVGTIRPPRRGYTRGLHTICAAGDWCLVDVEGYAVDLRNARYTCTQAIKRLCIRIGVSEDAIASLKRRFVATEATDVRAAQPFKSE
jgi:hypothetical protein